MAKRSTIFINLLNLEAKKIKDIISFFDNSNEIFTASSAALRAIASLSQSDIDKILSQRKSKTLDYELRLMEKNNINCLDIFDSDYPFLLKQIENSPLVLYLKGDSEVLNKFLFAIVGSRTPTTYGLSMAKKYAQEISSLGIVVVSGLAKGIDSAAHWSAMKNGQTVAILGSGLLNIYPQENYGLAKKISEQGAIISEFPLEARPAKENFPRRNRIISGLCRGVLVVEAAERSGALITAHLATEQNREVFSLPGKSNSALSKGTHQLIKEGAKLVDSLEDILEELDIAFEKVN